MYVVDGSVTTVISVLHLRRVRGARPTKRVWVFHVLHQSAATLCRWHCPRLTMLPREVFTAALKKDMTAVQDWLAQGGNPNEGLEQRTQTGFYVYQAGTTLLMVAAYRGRLDVVRLLVEAGADVNVRLPDDGRSALIFAVASCHADCIEYLLAHGGIVDGTQIKFCVISPFNTNPVAINIE